MNLRDKLRAVGGPAKSPASATRAEAPRDCARYVTRKRPEETPGAGALRRETLALMSDLALPEPFDPRRVLYLDTETTGLGGSGTVAFLVGVGNLTDEGFEVRQYLMRDYPEEPLLLKELAGELGQFDVLCTFNGATFDLPLLETRFLMNRMDKSCLALPHLDLLHLCRRLWKLRLGRCNLGRLEQVILGTTRENDLPGSQTPQRYFDYLKTKELSLLNDVLRHNAQDIVSLCVLLNRMAEMYQHPEEIPFAEDVYAMGRALERLKQPENARRCYRLARRGRMRAAASEALATSLRRGGEWDEAAGVWREMAREGRGGAAPYVALAKYEEHRRKDPAAALRWTEQALIRLAEPGLGETPAVQETKNELQYRQARLRRRLAARRGEAAENPRLDGNGTEGCRREKE